MMLGSEFEPASVDKSRPRGRDGGVVANEEDAGRETSVSDVVVGRCESRACKVD
jgi:hypothetical protein